MKDESHVIPVKPGYDVRGDSKPMGDAGTSTGMNGDSYGASLDQSATNSMGKGSYKSDPADRDMPMNPNGGY